jgi:hypothetical protein
MHLTLANQSFSTRASHKSGKFYAIQHGRQAQSTGQKAWLEYSSGRRPRRHQRSFVYDIMRERLKNLNPAQLDQVALVIKVDRN